MKKLNGTKVRFRRAKIQDAQRIYELIRSEALKGKLLFRPLREVRDFLDLFFVVQVEDQIVGCAALEVYYVLRKGKPKRRRLAEIRSLVVDRGFQRMGLGELLVRACLAEAKKQRVEKVLSVTSARRLFERLDFTFATETDDRFALFFNLKKRRRRTKANRSRH